MQKVAACRGAGRLQPIFNFTYSYLSTLSFIKNLEQLVYTLHGSCYLLEQSLFAALSQHSTLQLAPTL